MEEREVVKRKRNELGKDGWGEWKGERREFVLTLIAVEKRRERLQNKQRKLWINQQTRKGQGRSETKCFAVYLHPMEGGKGRLLLTMCLAGHKWVDLEMVGSVFSGCGDQGELIRW